MTTMARLPNRRGKAVDIRIRRSFVIVEERREEAGRIADCDASRRSPWSRTPALAATSMTSPR
jgi:hypothetical protein